VVFPPVTSVTACWPFFAARRYEIFSDFFRFVPYSGQQGDETFPPMSAEQTLGLASRIPVPHLMNICLPISLSRILRIACCVIGAMAAILISPRVVAQQPAVLSNGLLADI